MPLIIPKELPAYGELSRENVFVMHQQRAQTQQIRPLRILILNLMPTKIVTETQLARLLANSPLQVQLTFLQTKTHDTTHTPQEHMKAFYKTFDAVRNERFDGMIITGAPVEQMEFEEVDYWDEVVEIMEWSKTHVTSTLYICWAAQAGLYYHYGIKKHVLDKKISGVYEHHPLHSKVPIIRGFDDKFYVPHSRNTGVDGEAIKKNKELTVVAESDETGPYIILNSTGSQVFVTGHPEYDVMSLHYEYVRDVKRGLNPDIPKNYYKDNDPTKKPVKSWRCHANTMYYNWLNYYVYQVTPYDLEKKK